MLSRSRPNVFGEPGRDPFADGLRPMAYVSYAAVSHLLMEITLAYI